MHGYSSVKDWYLQSCSPSLLGTSAGNEDWANRLSASTSSKPWEEPPDEPPEQILAATLELPDAENHEGFRISFNRAKPNHSRLDVLPVKRQYCEFDAVLREITDQSVGGAEYTATKARASFAAQLPRGVASIYRNWNSSLTTWVKPSGP